MLEIGAPQSDSEEPKFSQYRGDCNAIHAQLRINNQHVCTYCSNHIVVVRRSGLLRVSSWANWGVTKAGPTLRTCPWEHLSSIVESLGAPRSFSVRLSQYKHSVPPNRRPNPVTTGPVGRSTIRKRHQTDSKRDPGHFNGRFVELNQV